MRYLLLIASDETRYAKMSEAEAAAMMEEYAAFNAAIEAEGAKVLASRLRPTSEATTVRVRDGDLLVTDGPFAETKEQLGGFYLIEADDLDDAIRWARRLPSARWGAVEIRPLWE